MFLEYAESKKFTTKMIETLVKNYVLSIQISLINH